MACGTSNSDLVEKPESKETLSEAESSSDDSVQDIGAEKENDKEEKKIADTETDTHNDIVPTWYLNSEGIGNKELGVFIRRNNNQLSKLELFSHSFTCNYYEGDLDAYILAPYTPFNDETTKKGKIHNIDYIYAPWSGSGVSIAFVGNGIAISTTTWLENEDIDDYISNLIELIKPDDVSNMDYLAYLADDGLYCPSLGIKFICDKEENEALFDYSTSGVTCLFSDISAITIQEYHPYMANVANAQEAVDQRVAELIEISSGLSECSAIEGTVEIKLGKCICLGKGVTRQFEHSDKEYWWLFNSDDTT